MVVEEAFPMPTPHGTRFNHLRQLYPSSYRVSLYNLHNHSSISLDDLSACGGKTKNSLRFDVQSVQLPSLAAVVRGSAAACDKIVQQIRIHSGHIDMTESNIPLTARVACAG